MKTTASTPGDVDRYVAAFPKDVQAILNRIRTTVRRAAPSAVETISYRIPSYMVDGRHIVYFAAYRHHIGVYPAPRGVAAFKKELARYGAGKGTLQFPLDAPVPYDIITKLVKFRVQELSAKKTVKRASR